MKLKKEQQTQQRKMKMLQHVQSEWIDQKRAEQQTPGQQQMRRTLKLQMLRDSPLLLLSSMLSRRNEAWETIAASTSRGWMMLTALRRRERKVQRDEFANQAEFHSRDFHAHSDVFDRRAVDREWGGGAVAGMMDALRSGWRQQRRRACGKQDEDEASSPQHSLLCPSPLSSLSHSNQTLRCLRARRWVIILG